MQDPIPFVSPSASDIGRDLVEDGFLLYSHAPENLKECGSKPDSKKGDEERWEFETRPKLSPERSPSARKVLAPQIPRFSPMNVDSNRELLRLGDNDGQMHSVHCLFHSTTGAQCESLHSLKITKTLLLCWDPIGLRWGRPSK
ncbi:hypothetical protein MSAN_00661700 [Mycena sanguinolenta]|uniref:Uncharacterized protein n=1 Tax=Mycena sanguinolenta TaxID=230812 RepID=A0A8H6Z3I7_9AGAR|nr:hypothetical protein MSAN_00661700 [Mycena sanguinolenta]